MKKAIEGLKELIVIMVLTFSGQTFANQNDLTLRQQECGSLLGTLQVRSGAQFPEIFFTERMKSSYIFDQDVEPVLRYISKQHLTAIESATKGAVFVIMHSSVAELNLLRSDLDFANRFAEYIKSRSKSKFARHFQHFERGFKESPVNGEMFQRLARLFFAYDYIRTLPTDATFYSIQEFTHLANIEGLQTQNYSQLYRIDSRDFKELALQKGFYPNPANMRGTISDHSSPRVGVKGAGYVSTTYEVGNRENLSVWPIVYAAKVHSIESSVISDLFPMVNQAEMQNSKPYSLRWDKENLLRPRLEILETNEYEIVNAMGAIPSVELSIESEKEVIIPFAEINQIKKTRKIYILAEVTRKNSGELYNYDFVDAKMSDWKSTSD